MSVFSISAPKECMQPRFREATWSLSFVERLALGIGIFEIPLQLDKYLMFHERDGNLGAVGGLNVSITSLCITLLYLIWIVRSSVARQRSSQALVAGYPMVLYITTVAMSVLAAQIPMLSLFDVALLLQAYAIFFYIANRIRDRADIIFVLAVVAATMAIQGLLIMGLSSMGSKAFGQRYEWGPLILMVWADGRPAGSMQSAVVAGSMLAMMWLPVMSLVLTRQAKWLWIFATAATVLGILGILLTQTRGAILTVFLGTIVQGFALLSRGWLPKWTLPMALSLALIGAYPLYLVVVKRVASGDEGSAESRKHLAAIALELINEQPIFGYGAGNCHLAGEKIANQGRFRSEWYYTVHCKYLLVWIETGIFGLLTFLTMMGNGMRHGLVAWRSRDRLLAPIGLALLSAIAGHMLHMIVDIFNSRSQVQMLWVILGIAAAVQKIATRDMNSCLQRQGHHHFGQ